MKIAGWQKRANAADSFFEDGDYELALSCYQGALKDLGPLDQQQDTVFNKNQLVSYLVNTDTDEWKVVRVTQVHTDDVVLDAMKDDDSEVGEPYYTITFEDEDGNAVEKQTTGDRLKPQFAVAGRKLLSKVVECLLLLGGDDNSKKAVEGAKQCIAMDEKWDQGHYLLARALLASGGDGSPLDEALTELDRCLMLNSDHEEAKQLLGEQWEKALAISAKSKSDGGTENLGTWQANKEAAEKKFKEGNYDAALNYCKKAKSFIFKTRTKAETRSILHLMVTCRLKLGGTEHAEAAVHEAKECIALRKNDSKAYLSLAKAYLALDTLEHGDKAADALQKSLKYNPSCTEAQLLLIRHVRSRHQAPRATTRGMTVSETFNSPYNDGEEQRKGVLRKCLTDIAAALGLDSLYRDVMVHYHRQPSEIQLLIKIILFLLGLRVAAFLLQFLFWCLLLPATLVPAAASKMAPEMAGDSTTNLLATLVIGGVAYWCHKNNINPFLALAAFNMVDGNRRFNTRDALIGAGVYEMVQDGQRRPQDRIYGHGLSPPYRWYHWHYWW